MPKRVSAPHEEEFLATIFITVNWSVKEVSGSYVVNDGHLNGCLFVAKLRWNGMLIGTDGESYVSMPSSGDCGGDMSLQEWGKVRELAQTDIVEQLIALARKHRTLA